MKRVLLALTATALVATSFGSPVQTADAEAASASVPTFTKDVAPIFNRSCVRCHRPGQIAPMALLAYQDVRPWVRSIKDKVVSREMPPWGADRTRGMKFRNDPSLTQQEIDTIVAWANGGAPKGDDADMPAPPAFASDSRWTNGEPDYVFQLPADQIIPAEGELDVSNLYTKIPFTEDRFAEAIEIRPSNPRVVHHLGAYVVDLPKGAQLDAQGRLVGERSNREDEGGDREQAGFELAGASKLISYVPGRGLEVHRPGTGKRLAAGKYVRWAVHYNATGKQEIDRTKLGIWFNTKPVAHEVLTRQAGNPVPTDRMGYNNYLVNGKEIATEDPRTGRRRSKIPNIPPYAENWTIVGVTPITEPITLYGLSPHMHLRGKSLKWVVVWPDGKEDVILDVPKFDFNWQIHYELETPLRLPAGSKLLGIGVYDNSLRNRWNPGPHLEVYWAEQSWDEMYQAFTEYSIDSQDLAKLETRRLTNQQ
ncbi:MAG: cytochrome c [Acidobacteria bacterium]|nr:cytochrome c [Acidobacteriota bacterium]